MARKQIGDPGDAAVVVSSVFLTVWERRESWAPVQVRAWLVRVTSNRASNFRASEKAERYRRKEFGDALARNRWVETPEERLCRQEVLDTTELAVESLPADLRDVARAILLDDFPVDEAARRIGVSRATAYRRLQRARRSLQTALRALWEDHRGLRGP